MTDYSTGFCRTLTEKFHRAGLHRPMRIDRYDAGTQLIYDVTSVEDDSNAKVHLVIEKFVGGGFAGQVYKIRITKIEAPDETVGGLKNNSVYAIKILVPPTGFAKLFRNALYWIGFQAPFQLQVNPIAARSGALWQKFIRRAAKIRFGSENAVVNIHATFVDENLGSCGEISEWIDGRTWQLEVDEHMDYLKQYLKGKTIDQAKLGSPEYRAKKKFMADFVNLLHEVGAPEFARQYEWSTCKSQPNCLKRFSTGNDPAKGLVAVDFRAGLTLLPFLPMSPGDFMLIAKGLKRGSIVQFDRGDIKKLEGFVQNHNDEFADMQQMLQQLKQSEQVYRNSIPDITHNHVRLLYSPKLWSTIFTSAVTGWKVRNLIDDNHETKLRKCKISAFLFFLIGIIPILGKVLRRLWARPDWRKHYLKILTSFDYLKQAVNAAATEKAISWYRAGRVSEKTAEKITGSFKLFLLHLPLSLIFVWLHRFITDSQYRKERLHYIFVRPIKLYFSRELREQWLKDMVKQGQKKHILSDEDAKLILSQINEPFIQKYLISLVVHLLTLPVTQIVSVTVAAVYVTTHWGQPNAWTIGIGIIAAFQVIPVSPGSLVRGLYVLYLVIKERDFKNYNIAVFLGFFKYIGYLAFPIQMAYHYPALARFMAAHWSTDAVHIVPVFGETGALLEHWVYCLFYNWPLTVRRRMRKIAKLRTQLKPRYWHIPIWAVIGAIALSSVDYQYFKSAGNLPDLRDIWLLSVLVPLIFGAIVTLGCDGAVLWKRFIVAGFGAIVLALFYSAASAVIIPEITIPDIAEVCAWRVFAFTIFSIAGAVITELKLPAPELK